LELTAAARATRTDAARGPAYNRHARRGATVAQLVERWALPAAERVRFGIIRRLLPDQLGYLVPLGPPPGS